MMQTGDNPDGPLTPKQAESMTAALVKDPDTFYDGFMTSFFSADGVLRVTEDQRQEALAQCRQADTRAAVACMEAFGTTDFRDDLAKIDVPALILHGDSDATVPYEGSGRRTAEAIPDSRVHLIDGGPHGCPVSHPVEWNQALLDFLER